MWNYQKAKKSKSSITKNNPSAFHLKRVDAQLIPIPDNESASLQSNENNFLPMRVLLNDITPKGFYGFSQKSIPDGTLAKLTILYKKPFFGKAKVVHCREYISDYAVISDEEKFKYRITLEFYFENDLEKQRVKNFIKELLQDEIIRKKK